jgi:hypothetical protein
VLSYLAERPGQLVTKEELFHVVWADTVVSDGALTMCIQEIRKTLGDNAREPQYIETVPKRGVRFIAEINRRTQAVTNGKGGQPRRGVALVTEAVAFMEKHGERFYEAELYRIKGELALRAGETAKRGNGEKVSLPDPKSQILAPEGEAEACFQKAIEIARKQQAKSFELRATVSLARLLQRQSKRYEEHKMLLEIYNWFTEGFDTKDLQEAKALLENLGEMRKRRNGVGIMAR